MDLGDLKPELRKSQNCFNFDAGCFVIPSYQPLQKQQLRCRTLSQQVRHRPLIRTHLTIEC